MLDAEPGKVRPVRVRSGASVGEGRETEEVGLCCGLLSGDGTARKRDYDAESFRMYTRTL